MPTRERVLRRFTNSNGTTIITYPFGSEEHQYSSTGSNQWNIYYYFLGGRLMGALDGNGTQFYLVDALGSLVSAFNNSQGGAALKSNQLFGPYGNGRYYACCLNTARGFLGQYNDGTGLDYLNARYYDPVAGVFLSADTVEGNMQGMNPYAYVGGNPETHSDPSGRYRITTGGGIGNAPPPPTPRRNHLAVTSSARCGTGPGPSAVVWCMWRPKSAISSPEPPPSSAMSRRSSTPRPACGTRSGQAWIELAPLFLLRMLAPWLLAPWFQPAVDDLIASHKSLGLQFLPLPVAVVTSLLPPLF